MPVASPASRGTSDSIVLVFESSSLRWTTAFSVDDSMANNAAGSKAARGPALRVPASNWKVTLVDWMHVQLSPRSPSSGILGLPCYTNNFEAVA